MHVMPVPATQDRPIDGLGTERMLAHSARGERTSEPRRLARIAGLMYVINAIFAGFAFGLVATKMYAAGDAAATAANVLANPGLVRVGVVADLFQATEWVFLAMALYLLLRHVSTDVARGMVVLVAVGAAIVCLNDVFEFVAVRVATDGFYAAALGVAGSNALVLVLFDLQHYGFLIAQIFFGLWLLPLGYLAYRSGMFPRALGVMLIAAGVCYLADMLVLFLAPGLGGQINAFLVIPPMIAELWMALYLVVKGVRSSGSTHGAAIVATRQAATTA
jgi:hypothetical protein